MITITKDIEYSHSFLSYLLAGLQGRFAYLNILARIGSGQSDEERELVGQLQQQIDKANGWMKQTMTEKPLFQLAWKEPLTEPAKEAYKISEELTQDLEMLATDLASILKQKQFNENSGPRLVLLLAALGRHTYARDNYLRYFYNFFKEVGDSEEATRFRTGVKSSEKDVEYANELITAYQQYTDLPLEYYHALFAEVVALPGLFRTQVFDIRMLASVYRGNFSFVLAKIPEERAQQWQHVGLGPIEAGHWEAQEIGPAEALDWIQKEISDPSLAGLWKAWRFPAFEAAKWVKEGFAPKDATDWANAEFDPTEAKQLINRGVSHPSLIKE